MMNTKNDMRWLVIGSLLLISSCGCHFPITSHSNGEDVSTIMTDVVLQQKGVYHGPIFNLQQEDSYVYLRGNSIVKYDLSQHSIKWERKETELFEQNHNADYGVSDIILAEEIYAPIRTYDDNMYFKSPYLVAIDKETGGVIKRIRILDQKYIYSYRWVKYNSKLFFGYRGQSYTDRDGFGYIDLNELKTDTESTEENAYTAAVHTIMEIPQNCAALYGVSALPGDSYGYAVWYPCKDTIASGDEGLPQHGIMAINLQTGGIEWKDESYQAGLGADIQSITDKYVFAFERNKVIDKRGVAIYKKETGERLKSLWNVWSANKDFIWDKENQRIYLTTGTAIEEFPEVAAIYCLNAETGDIIWSRYRDWSEPQIGMQPQVHQGILYVPTARYLELYDASNGKPLGRDARVWGDGENFGDSAVWNNCIFFHDGRDTLFGVAMNWKVVNGQLVKGE
ncbi:MAG: hypothetical protein LDL24_06405 [Treponema sp.]|nr:hypothetical protein [Treponema sp.]